MNTNSQQGLVGDVVIGIVGAGVGGFLVRVLGGPVVEGFNLFSLLIAIIGSVVLLALIKLVQARF